MYENVPILEITAWVVRLPGKGGRGDTRLREFLRYLRRLLLPVFLVRLARRVKLWLRIAIAGLGRAIRFAVKQTILILAPAIIVVGTGIFSFLFFQPIPPLQLLLIAAVSAALCILAYMVSFIWQDEKWREFDRRLDEPCRPDNDPYTASLDIRGESRFDRDNFVRDFNKIPCECRNVLLLLRQTQKSWWDRSFPYSVESIRRQIEALEDRNPEGARKIKWVCFVTRYGSFAAYQAFKKFRGQIALGNAIYADILNIREPAEFRNTLEKQPKEEDNRERGLAAEQNIIPNLKTGVLPNRPLTNRETMVRLLDNDWHEAMLVTTHEHKPVGIVTLSDLIKRILPLDLMSNVGKEALENEIKTWCNASSQSIGERETPDNRPRPPEDYGDDDPARNAMIAGGPRRRKPADLRFTRP